jgi:hypothetical protein
MKISPEFLRTMVVQVTSPDGRIQAKLQYPEDVDIRFLGDAYRQYSERDLEHQLGRTATLLWTAYRKGYVMALSKHTGREVKDGQPHWDARNRRYQTDVSEIVSVAASPSGAVKFKAKGLAFWKVRIKDGTVDSVPEEMFMTETKTAVASLLNDFRMQCILLKDKHFGLNIPTSWRKKNPLLDEV